VLGKNDTHNKYFEQFYRLQKTLTTMKKFYAPGYEESKKKYEALKQGSFFVFAYSNDIPIAAVWYGFDKKVVTYLQTGITKFGYAKLANYLLVLEGIKKAKKLQCYVFDFESIYDIRYPHESKRWKGYSEFKSRFHGEVIYYPPSWIKIYNPFFKWFYILSERFLP
jgi:lipid II:glycine glycyltransferase (peptidoglycan interpeptide bridge formation enzyme)